MGRPETALISASIKPIPFCEGGFFMAQVKKRREADDPMRGGLAIAACALVGAFVGVTMDNLVVGIVLGCVFGVAVSMTKRR